MYKLEIKSNERIFLITMGGLISKQEGKQYLVELIEKMKTFDTSQYYLVVDTQELKASTQDSMDNIKNYIELLTKTPFKGRYNIAPKSSITALQAKRIVKSDVFSKIISVSSYEEIFSSENFNNHGEESIIKIS